MEGFSHLNAANKAKMVNVGDKLSTKRKATASVKVTLGLELFNQLIQEEGVHELKMPKGPVFQTAIIAGIQGVKQTPFLIPMCHPLQISGVDIIIQPKQEGQIEILCTVSLEGKTGVEMEALMGANIAALTVYDMCKAVNPHILIEELKLISKEGGKNDFSL